MTEIEQPGIFDSRGALAPLDPNQIKNLSADRKRRYSDVAQAALANTAAEDEVTAARRAVKAATKTLVQAGAAYLRMSPPISFADALKAARDAYNNSNRRN